MDRIIYTNISGVVSVVAPAAAYVDNLEGLEALLKEKGQLISIDTPEHVPLSDIPSDRTFRDAWKRGEQGNKVGVDMVKAKEVSHGKRREKRDELFRPLDIKSTIPSEAAQAEADRQVIRDNDVVVQEGIDSASTPEELKTILENYGVI